MRVVTAKARPYAVRILEHFEIDGFFDAVHGPGLGDRAYDKAMLLGEALRAGSPGRSLMIGDRADDIRAAGRNGIPAIAARWGYGSPEELLAAGPAYMADHISDVVHVVRRLELTLPSLAQER